MKIAITGNRYSGKNRVSNIFKQIGIPVFDADIALKYILATDFELMSQIKHKYGISIFNATSKKSNFIPTLSTKLILEDKLFGDIFLLAKQRLLDLYNNFLIKNNKSLYTIFKFSILYETGLDVLFDDVICVYTPMYQRVERCKSITGGRNTELFELAKSEMSEISKNEKSKYVIHNYECGIDILDTINNIDKELVNQIINNDVNNLVA